MTVEKRVQPNSTSYRSGDGVEAIFDDLLCSSNADQVDHRTKDRGRAAMHMHSFEGFRFELDRVGNIIGCLSPRAVGVSGG